jgi:hypothetical protein
MAAISGVVLSDAFQLMPLTTRRTQQLQAFVSREQGVSRRESLLAAFILPLVPASIVFADEVVSYETIPISTDKVFLPTATRVQIICDLTEPPIHV